MREPTTTLTDYALTVLAAAFAVSLIRHGIGTGTVSVLLWAGAFATTALAAATGGTVHGFPDRLGDACTRRLWKVTLHLLGVTAFLLLASAAFATVPPAWRLVLVAAAALKLVAATVRVRQDATFRVAIYDYGASLLAVLLLFAWAALRGAAPGAGWIAAGILLSFVGAGVQQAGRGLHRHMNHNDLYHLIQMAALYLLYRGGLLLQDW